MNRDIYFAETKYGFKWGEAEIERVASFDDGSVVIFIKTKKDALEVRITRTGFIRTKGILVNKIIEEV